MANGMFPEYMTEEEKELARKRMMMGMGMRMLAGSGYSPVKKSLGNIIGEAGIGTMADYDQIMGDARSEREFQMKKEAFERQKAQQDLQRRQAMQAQTRRGNMADFMQTGTTNFPSNQPGMYNPGTPPPQQGMTQRLMAAELLRSNEPEAASKVMQPRLTNVPQGGTLFDEWTGRKVAEGQPPTSTTKPPKHSIVESNGLQYTWNPMNPKEGVKPLLGPDGKQLPADGSENTYARERLDLSRNKAASAELDKLFEYSEDFGFRDKAMRPYAAEAKAEITEKLKDLSVHPTDVGAQIGSKAFVRYKADKEVRKMVQKKKPAEEIKKYRDRADEIIEALEQGVSISKIVKKLKDVGDDPGKYGL